MQSYLPFLGWGLLALVAIFLTFREVHVSRLGQSLKSTQQALQLVQGERGEWQASASAKDRSISQMTQKINQIERDLKKSQNQFADEKSRLTSREAELLKAKADSIAAHTELQEIHQKALSDHSSTSHQASSCSQTLTQMKTKNAELSKDLGQQYDVAAELRRSLEAEVALHKSNEKQWRNKEEDLRRQLSGLEEHHASCTKESSTDDGHTHQHPESDADQQSGSLRQDPDSITQKLASVMPTREMLQQAHPGIAAAADILLGQTAQNTSHNASAQVHNNSQNVQEQSGSEDQSQKGFDQQIVTDVEGHIGQAEIPWRQVAGLLHSQGITDPQGLGHMTETLKTFVGARLAVDKDRGQVPLADATAEDEALVTLLSGAGVSDPKGRAHFAQALRDHLLETQMQDSVADTDVDAQTGTDSLQSDSEQQQQSTAAHQSEHGHQHGIASHAHRASLTDEVGSTADEPNKQDASSKQTA